MRYFEKNLVVPIDTTGGNMSFVGPRPTLATAPFDEVAVERRKRYEVRPGITGYAQAYYRNSISQDDKFKYDIYYVDHVSFWFDVKILFKTAVSVIKHENIYVSKANGGDKHQIKKREADRR